jgi:hypothetical protein
MSAMSPDAMMSGASQSFLARNSSPARTRRLGSCGAPVVWVLFALMVLDPLAEVGLEPVEDACVAQAHGERLAVAVCALG